MRVVLVVWWVWCNRVGSVMWEFLFLLGNEKGCNVCFCVYICLLKFV